MSPSPRAESPSPPRVVIIDADRRVQQSLADLLGVTGAVEVVARAGDVRGGLEAVESHQPNAVLIDPRLPDVEAGMALIAGISRAWPQTRVVLTGWTDPNGQESVPAARTRYVSKNGTPEEFVAAIVDACVPG